MDPMTDTEVPRRDENEPASARAVFVDIDGTLCDSRQQIPESALEADRPEARVDLGSGASRAREESVAS